MGNSASKAAKTAAVQASKRQYPTRIPPVAATKAGDSNQGPRVHTTEQASEKRTDAINRDAFDPQLGAALRSLGPVQPTPTQSNSSTAQSSHTVGNGVGGAQPIFADPRNNPALLLLDARKKLAEQAEAEIEQYGRRGFQGKRFLDVTTIRDILIKRDQQGMQDADIEHQLELQAGIVARLPKGVFSTPDLTSASESGIRR